MREEMGLAPSAADGGAMRTANCAPRQLNRRTASLLTASLKSASWMPPRLVTCSNNPNGMIMLPAMLARRTPPAISAAGNLRPWSPKTRKMPPTSVTGCVICTAAASTS